MDGRKRRTWKVQQFIMHGLVLHVVLIYSKKGNFFGQLQKATETASNTPSSPAQTHYSAFVREPMARYGSKKRNVRRMLFPLSSE